MTRNLLWGVVQPIDARGGQVVHLVHHGPDVHLTQAPDELRDADAFERSWKVSKPGFCHRAEKDLPRRNGGSAWLVGRTNVCALLQL